MIFEIDKKEVDLYLAKTKLLYEVIKSSPDSMRNSNAVEVFTIGNNQVAFRFSVQALTIEQTFSADVERPGSYRFNFLKLQNLVRAINTEAYFYRFIAQEENLKVDFELGSFSLEILQSENPVSEDLIQDAEGALIFDMSFEEFKDVWTHIHPSLSIHSEERKKPYAYVVALRSIQNGVRFRTTDGDRLSQYNFKKESSKEYAIFSEIYVDYGALFLLSEIYGFANLDWRIDQKSSAMRVTSSEGMSFEFEYQKKYKSPAKRLNYPSFERLERDRSDEDISVAVPKGHFVNALKVSAVAEEHKLNPVCELSFSKLGKGRTKIETFFPSIKADDFEGVLEIETSYSRHEVPIILENNLWPCSIYLNPSKVLEIVENINSDVIMLRFMPDNYAKVVLFSGSENHFYTGITPAKKPPDLP